MLPFQMRRRQFPVRLAFAVTINKSQGQSMKKVGVFLPHPVFTHGQLYVALSRVGSATDVTVYVEDQKDECQGRFKKRSGVYTKNIVYGEVYTGLQTAHNATSDVADDSDDFDVAADLDDFDKDRNAFDTVDCDDLHDIGARTVIGSQSSMLVLEP